MAFELAGGILILGVVFSLLSHSCGTRLECNEGEVEWQGRCESCETAIKAGWTTGKNSCHQCPDVTKRGLYCDVSCSKNCAEGCERWTGHCHGCKTSGNNAGRHGVYCEQDCSVNCVKRLCNETDESCLQGCITGYFGRLCNQNCPASCLCENGKTCTNPPCTEEGNCVNNCTEGYYGGDCSIPCTANCSTNSCTREGKCHACTQGSYGGQCQLPCSDHCTDKQCHQHTGVCSHGCEAGFWGDTCVSACPDSCVYCINSIDCYLCKDGWGGTACQHRCRGHCHGGCDYTGQCEQCKDGFYGIDCNNTCSQNCFSPTNGPGACNRRSGHCLHGCKNGFFGLWCDAECSDYCVDRTCQGQFPKHGGTCVKGCKDGYRGVYCQVPCPDHCQTCSQRDMGCGQCQDGWYGSVCQEPCQDCSGSCHKDTGRCTSALITTPVSASLNTLHLIVSVVPACVLVGLIALGVLVCCRRQRFHREEETRNEVLVALRQDP